LPQLKEQILHKHPSVKIKNLDTVRTKNVLAVIVIIMLCAYFVHLPSEQEWETTAESFVTNLILGADVSEMSMGTVKYNLTRRPLSGYRVIDVQAKTIEIGRDNAMVFLTTQSEKDGIYNLEWHNLYMFKQNNQWRVYRIVDTEPTIISGQINGVEDAVQVLQSYMQHLSGDYIEAATYLAGKARAKHLQMEEVFQLQLKEWEYTNLHYLPVSGDGVTLLLMIEYEVDNRQMNALVSFYRANKGWMIYDISQI